MKKIFCPKFGFFFALSDIIVSIFRYHVSYLQVGSFGHGKVVESYIYIPMAGGLLINIPRWAAASLLGRISQFVVNKTFFRDPTGHPVRMYKLTNELESEEGGGV